jgi:predicted amidohydrolase YtcJ
MDMNQTTVFTNANVRTLDEFGTRADAVAVRGDVVVAVGKSDAVREGMGARARIVNVGGRTLLPALTDSHTHFHRASAVLSLYIDYMELAPRSFEDVFAPIAERVAMLDEADWVQGDSLDPHRLRERRFPVRQELDRIAPRHPVVIRGVGRHVVAANSRALELAGIDETTPDPPGGSLDRDENGIPTGVLQEHGKLRLDNAQIDTVIPRPSEEQRLNALRAGIAMLHRNGIACIHEMAREPNDIADYLRLRELGDLRLRVRIYERGLNAYTSLDHVVGAGLRTGFGDDWIRLGGIKLSIDGSDTARNAALYSPYPGQAENIGIVRIEQDDLNRAVSSAHENGLEVAIHAIGPRAVDMALDAFQAAKEGHSHPQLNHRIEHAYMPPRAGQLERMAALGVTLSTQSSFIYASGDAWRSIHGDEAVADSVPLRSALDAGLKLQLNSDYPCSPLNPFIGIGSAVSRLTRDGWVVPGNQNLTGEEAIRAMTNACAYSMSAEGHQGSIRPGAFADLIVTDIDPCEATGKEIIDTTVLLTMVAGEIVFDQLSE